MPKTARSSASVRERWSGEGFARNNNRRRRRGRPPIEMDRVELISAVCEFFCQGRTITEILGDMEEKYGSSVGLTREDPYAMIHYAASKGWIRFHPPHQLVYERQIHKRYGDWLKSVDVVRTAVSTDVAKRAARVLIGLLQQFHDANRSRQEVHIGFAGGFSMRQLAREFADLLCQQFENLPPKVYLHAMVAGSDPSDPTTDPNAFFTYFLNKAVMQVAPHFVGLHAPAMVRTEGIPDLMQHVEIAQAYEAASELDIIVTSGSDWADKHSSLRTCMARSEESLGLLEHVGTKADLLWRPINASGPVEQETEIRAMTLMELSALPGFIAAGGRVLLMLGPCGRCGQPKGKVLQTILNLDQHLITHLVVDSRSGGQLVRFLKEEARE